jgi:tetratricopeptide (TPR) repeat protein
VWLTQPFHFLKAGQWTKKTLNITKQRKSERTSIMANRGPGKNTENLMLSKSMTSLDPVHPPRTGDNLGRTLNTTQALISKTQMATMTVKAQQMYNAGSYSDALNLCDKIYEQDAQREDNLLLIGAIHFQLRNFSESIFYNQQCIKVDSNYAEAYSNLGNALKELGDLKGATQFYMKVNFILSQQISTNN